MATEKNISFLGEMIFFMIFAVILATLSIVAGHQGRVTQHIACKYVAEAIKNDINIMGREDDLRQNCDKEDLLLFLPPGAAYTEADFERVEREMCMEYDVQHLYEIPQFTFVKELWQRGDLFCDEQLDVDGEHRCSGGNSVGNWRNWWLSDEEYKFLKTIRHGIQ